jgi:hypothetical protein
LTGIDPKSNPKVKARNHRLAESPHPVGKSAVRSARPVRCYLAGFETMAAASLASSARNSLASEFLLKCLLFSVLAYWGLIALLYPVTTWDCQVYNLSRLLVAERVDSGTLSPGTQNPRLCFRGRLMRSIIPCLSWVSRSHCQAS